MRRLSNLGQVSGSGKGPWERRLLLWLVVAAIIAVVAVTAAYYFDVATESRAFCGLLCHSNTPQYVTQEVSAHADVECGICHIGPGLMPKVMAKVYGTGEMYKQLTNTFERPIEHPVARLRPADEICEQCHSPHQPYEDQIETIRRFASDEANSETRLYLAMRIGSGDSEGGAHWHIDNPVWYVSRDEADHQDIPWVQAMGDDGQTVVYQPTEGALSAAELSELPRREMDCMDCHNRATHQFRNPEDRVDEAMASGDIDPDLPYVKREALKLLSAGYRSQQDGVAAMEDLAQFYRSEYPDAYGSQQESIAQAVTALQEIYQETVFPEMRLTWDFYPDNLGHKDFPGCFRCHDGKHLNEQDEPIPNNCTLCHSVPVSVGPDQDAPGGGVLRGMVLPDKKPDSHFAADFALTHRVLADDTCSDCHGTIEYGTDNSSFCANGICHDQEWPESPAVASFVHPAVIAGQHTRLSCNECHQGVREPAIEDCATCHQPPREPHFGSACSDCHNPYDWEDSAAAWLAVVSTVPHRIETGMDCTTCHTDGSATTVPANHAAFSGQLCVRCHGDDSGVKLVSVPHIVEGRERCLVCHDRGKLSPVPSNHEGWSNEFCSLCHE